MHHAPPVISITYDPALRRRLARFSGVLGDEHLFGAYGALLERPDYDYGADDLVDLSDVTRLAVTSDGLRQLMGMFAEADELGYRTRLAIVAPADAVYGVSRMYQLMRGDDVPEEIVVFRRLAEATAWLDHGARTQGLADAS
jgi:hypothetical protein